MPVRKDASGKRSVEAKVEVPGTPEEVSRAIATGKGISAWFVPSTSDERVGGAAVASFGPGMESVATIKLIAMAPEPKSKAWAALSDALGFSGATPGGRREATEGVPPMGGIIESVGVEDHPELLVRLDRPTSG